MDLIDTLMQNKIANAIVWILTTVFLIQQTFTQGYSLLKLRVNKPLWIVLIPCLAIIILSYNIGKQKSNVEKEPEDYEKINGEIFSNQRIRVDGKDFKNCQFNSTTLVYSGYSGANFDYPVFVGDVTWAFDGPASRTISQLSFLYKQEIYKNKVEQLFDNIRKGTVPQYPEINTKYDSFK